MSLDRCNRTRAATDELNWAASFTPDTKEVYYCGLAHVTSLGKSSNFVRGLDLIVGELPHYNKCGIIVMLPNYLRKISSRKVSFLIVHNTSMEIILIFKILNWFGALAFLNFLLLYSYFLRNSVRNYQLSNFHDSTNNW